MVIDLVATLLFESEEKLDNAELAIKEKQWSDSIYYSYTALINTAKALLTSKEIKTNTQSGIVKLFDDHFVATKTIELTGTFTELVLQLKQNDGLAVKVSGQRSKDAVKIYSQQIQSAYSGL